jgi:hypothetical protein
LLTKRTVTGSIRLIIGSSRKCTTGGVIRAIVTPRGILKEVELSG